SVPRIRPAVPRIPPTQSGRYIPPMSSADRTCIIGAGSSGIVAAQVLGARGVDYDIFEKGSQIDGNWRYENDNGMSSAYRSLHINTSRRGMAVKNLPKIERTH